MTLPNQPPPTLITGLVLAGGQSRRMGQDKALLCWRGEALLTRSCRLALGLGDRLWVITSRPDTYRPHLPPGCGILLEPPIAPGARSPGPLLALARGLAAVETDWALLLACDLPCLRAVDLQRAAADLAGLPAAVAAYLPRAVLSQTAGPEPAVSQPGPIAPPAWEPLCGFYRRSCLASLQRAVARGERSLQAWLRQLAIAPIVNWPAEALLNCNRPEDWLQAQQILASRGGWEADSRGNS